MAYRDYIDILGIHLQDIQNANAIVLKYNNQELFERLNNGDNNALDLLIVKNMPLVLTIAKRYKNHGVDYIDLIEEGYFSLIEAIKNFDIKIGLNFSTYAFKCITGSLRKYINKHNRNVSVPDDTLHYTLELKNIIDCFKVKYGYMPSFSEMAELMHVSVSRVIGLYNCLFEEVSLNENVQIKNGKVLEDVEMIETISSECDVEDEVVNKELSSFLKNIINSSNLTNHERVFIGYCYGLNNNIRLRQSDIAALFGVSRQYVSFTIKKGLTKLKKIIINSEEYGPDFNKEKGINL